jgi:hypothetical protein
MLVKSPVTLLGAMTEELAGGNRGGLSVPSLGQRRDGEPAGTGGRGDVVGSWDGATLDHGGVRDAREDDGGSLSRLHGAWAHDDPRGLAGRVDGGAAGGGGTALGDAVLDVALALGTEAGGVAAADAVREAVHAEGAGVGGREPPATAFGDGRIGAQPVAMRARPSGMVRTRRKRMRRERTWARPRKSIGRRLQRPGGHRGQVGVFADRRENDAVDSALSWFVKTVET